MNVLLSFSFHLYCAKLFDIVIQCNAGATAPILQRGIKTALPTAASSLRIAGRADGAAGQNGARWTVGATPGGATQIAQRLHPEQPISCDLVGVR